MWHDIRCVAAKDLRIEARSRVTTNQVLPFAVLVLVLFAIAFDANDDLLQRTTPGIYWVAVVFAALLAVQRTFAIEAADDAGRALLLTGMAPAGVFLGKVAAMVVQLLVLQVVVAAAVAILYSPKSFDATGWVALAAAAVLGTVGIAAFGAIYGSLSSGHRVESSLLPLLLLPALVPLLIAATRAFEAGMQAVRGESGVAAQAVSEAWPWVGLLAVFAAVGVTAGTLVFGAILDDA
jgi:heme exporter protein B